MVEFKWNDKARVHMVEKSEFYNDSRFYRYGFYDGYLKAIKDCKSNEMLEMLKDIKDYLGSDKRQEVEQLIKEATEL